MARPGEMRSRKWAARAGFQPVRGNPLSAEVVSLALTGVLLMSTVIGCKKSKPPPPKPSVVQVITVTPQSVPIYKEWIGTLEGFVNAQIRAQVAGYLLSQDYTEGSEVKKGDLL